MLPIKRKAPKNAPRKRPKLRELLLSDPFHPSIDYSKAEVAETLVKLFPDNARYNFEVSQLVDGASRVKYKKRLKFVNKAITLDPNCAEYYFARGNNGDLQKAMMLDPDNADYQVAQLQHCVDSVGRAWGDDYEEKRDACLKKIDALLSKYPEHPRLCFMRANFSKRYRTGYWSYGLLQYNSQLGASLVCAQNALLGTLKSDEKVLIHDILACVYAHLGSTKKALEHYDKALEIDPLEENRNYWKYLKKTKAKPDLLKLVQHIKKSFTVRKDCGIEEFFDRWAILTPGYRALVRKNNAQAVYLMRRHASRECQWMMTLHPFNSEDFPVVVTDAILNFLFFI